MTLYVRLVCRELAKSVAIIRLLVAHYEKYWQRIVAKVDRKVSAVLVILNSANAFIGLYFLIAHDRDAIGLSFLLALSFLPILYISVFSFSFLNILQK